MLEECFALAITLVVNLVDANFLIPRRNGKIICGGGERDLRDAILWRLGESHILGDVSCGACSCGG
jgi:hypothetical protein